MRRETDSSPQVILQHFDEHTIEHIKHIAADLFHHLQRSTQRHIIGIPVLRQLRRFPGAGMHRGVGASNAEWLRALERNCRPPPTWYHCPRRQL